MIIPRIFADFGNADSQGRVRLTTNGSREDIKAQKIELSNGMHIVIYDDDLSAEAEVLFSGEEKIWVAQIDWQKIKRQPKT